MNREMTHIVDFSNAVIIPSEKRADYIEENRVHLMKMLEGMPVGTYRQTYISTGNMMIVSDGFVYEEGQKIENGERIPGTGTIHIGITHHECDMVRIGHHYTPEYRNGLY